MNTPNPLPVAGDWLVTADGGMYEIVNHCEAPGSCAGAADDGGCWYLAVDSDEVLWSGWDDVEAVGTAAEVDAVSERLTAEAAGRRDLWAERLTVEAAARYRAAGYLRPLAWPHDEPRALARYALTVERDGTLTIERLP